MSRNPINTYEMKLKRMNDAITLKEPDRVPFAPKTSMVYRHFAGVSNYEALSDFRNIKKGVVNFLERYEVDLFQSPSGYPISVMEALGTSFIKWPGETCKIDLNSGYQVLDRTFLEDDEYGEFLSDPSHFFLTKVFPRKHDQLKALEKVAFNQVVEFGHFAAMQAFANPDVREAFFALMKAGEEAVKWQKARMEINQAALEMETPLLGGSIGAPYDMFADNIRGFLNLGMDIHERPELVLKAIDIMEHIAMNSIEGLKKMGARYCFIPLHGGSDDFMSEANYRKFYWPSLQRLMEKLIANDIVPYVFCEGKYNSRLEILREITPRKVIYMFEQVDIAKAKSVLKDVACIGGNFPTANLCFSSKEEIIEDTKRMLDVCAPGGGFIMDCSITMDNLKIENFDAWYETTMKYGVY